MSKVSYIFVVSLFATAVAFADEAQWQSPAYEAIGEEATGVSALDSMNGSWSAFSAGSAFFDSATKTLEFNLEDGSLAKFDVAENTQEDTNTCSKISITADFIPLVDAEEFLTKAELEEQGAQVGFVVYDNKYYGWAGGDNWVELSGTPTAGTVTLVIELVYWQDTPQAKFSIGGNELGTIALSSAAKTAGRVIGCSFGGYGDVKAVDGELQLGVAEYAGRKYGTANSAIEAASEAGGEVKLLKTVDGDIAQGSDKVKLNMNGQEVEGEVQIVRGSTLEVKGNDDQQIDLSSVKVATGEGTVKLRLASNTLSNSVITVGTDASNVNDFSVDAAGADPTKQYVKEVDGSDIKIRIETADSVIAAITRGGKAMTHAASLKTFLSKYDNYKNANSTSAKIEAILDTTDSGNNLTRFQEYALGVEADSGKKVYAEPPVDGDTDSNNVTLTFPTVNPPADSGYTVKYKVGDTEYDSQDAAKLPLSSPNGAYELKIIIK